MLISTLLTTKWWCWCQFLNDDRISIFMKSFNIDACHPCKDAVTNMRFLIDYCWCWCKTINLVDTTGHQHAKILPTNFRWSRWIMLLGGFISFIAFITAFMFQLNRLCQCQYNLDTKLPYECPSQSSGI